MYARRQRFVYATAGWMLAAVLALSVFQFLTLPAVFVLSLVGFLLLAELYTPASGLARWQGRLRWVTVLGFVAFAVYAVDRLVTLLRAGGL
jgi:hypothetical protein